MSTRPNVLLVTTDHWPGALLGVAGHPVIQTPTLDELARSGMRFTRAYSECPVCIPARRTLMTGVMARTHGDRVFKERLGMPELPTLAQTFRDAGYQAFAVGKLHVFPQRSRIGFDDVILAEEGRGQFGVVDDYEMFLGDRGHVGQYMTHGMGNNQYVNRPWHLPEDCHVTNWTTSQMARMIRRRDPTRPGFWYLSYCHPHPPLAPLQCYLDMYRELEPPAPPVGEWATHPGALPYRLRTRHLETAHFNAPFIRSALRAFYALCTHLDHQLRVVIGTLREEGLLDHTILLITADHGDMLGAHGLWGKQLFYDPSANVPMILLGAADDGRVGHHRVGDRLVGLQDVMPTLLDLAGIEIPKSVEGLSMVGSRRREHLYGEIGEAANASRMIHDGRFKLIYYPAGNHRQLFDLQSDPQELRDLADSPAHSEIREQLSSLLAAELYGGDEQWARAGQFDGLPEPAVEPKPNRGLTAQRGVHWPPPPGPGR